MSLPIEAVLLLLIALYSAAGYFNNSTMHRHWWRTVLPSYPNHNEPATNSRISGSNNSNAKSRGSYHDKSRDDRGSSEDFYPSLQDVSQVREMLGTLWTSPLSTTTTSQRKVTLPDEVIDMILDEAEYWPSVVTSLRTTPFVISTDGDREFLRTLPLCYDPDVAEELDQQEKYDSHDTSHILLHRGKHPCRKIVFDISSHDQGWGGERGHQGTFKGSWTWFSAYISPHRNRRQERLAAPANESSSSDGERRSPSAHPRPFLPEPAKLQCNRTATINSSNYHIVWHYLDDIKPESDEAECIEEETGRGRATLDGKAVREMEVGDEVSVWLRARFAGWRNHVDRLSVRVYWAA